MIKMPKLKEKVYHGTADRFDSIDLNAGKKYKDFGNGFYLSFNKEHAEKKARLMAKIRKSDAKYVYVYSTLQVEFEKLYKLGRVKIFHEPDIEWVEDFRH